MAGIEDSKGYTVMDRATEKAVIDAQLALSTEEKHTAQARCSMATVLVDGQQAAATNSTAMGTHTHPIPASIVTYLVRTMNNQNLGKIGLVIRRMGTEPSKPVRYGLEEVAVDRKTIAAATMDSIVGEL